MKQLINKTVIFFTLVIAMTSCNKDADAQPLPCATCPPQATTSTLVAGQSIYVTIDPAFIPNDPQTDQIIPTFTGLGAALNPTTYGTPADMFYGKAIDYAYWTLKFKRVGTLEFYDIIVSRDLCSSLKTQGKIFIAQVFAQPIAASSVVWYNNVCYLNPNSTTKIVMVIVGAAN